MKSFNLFNILLICFEIIFTKKIFLRELKENKENININININKNLKNLVEKEEEKNESKNKEEEIFNNLLLIQKIENEIDSSISEMKEKLNKINAQKINMDGNLKNMKKIINKEEEVKKIYKVKLFIYFIVLLGMIIYIIELKYENNQIEKKQNRRTVGNYNSSKINDRESTKLYMSL